MACGMVPSNKVNFSEKICILFHSFSYFQERYIILLKHMHSAVYLRDLNQASRGYKD
jgi:hypothetical protein